LDIKIIIPVEELIHAVQFIVNNSFVLGGIPGIEDLLFEPFFSIFSFRGTISKVKNKVRSFILEKRNRSSLIGIQANGELDCGM